MAERQASAGKYVIDLASDASEFWEAVVGLADDGGSECVRAKLSENARRNLRVTYCGLSILVF